MCPDEMPRSFLLAWKTKSRPQSRAARPPGWCGGAEGQASVLLLTALSWFLCRAGPGVVLPHPSSSLSAKSKAESPHAVYSCIYFFPNVIIFNEENNILAPRQIKREGTKYISCCHKSLKKKDLFVVRTIYFFFI